MKLGKKRPPAPPPKPCGTCNGTGKTWVTVVTPGTGNPAKEVTCPACRGRKTR